MDTVTSSKRQQPEKAPVNEEETLTTGQAANDPKTTLYIGTVK